MDIKNVGGQDQVMKSRYTVQGHNDKEKNTLIQNYPSLRQLKVRFVLAVSGLIKFKVWTVCVA